MKKLIPLLLSLAFVLTLIGCTSEDKATFQATILEIQDGYYLVEPAEGSTELNSADQITVPMVNINPSQEPEVGDTVEIVYDGAIAESYPAQMLMYGKEASNRKQEIDRQHHTIPNQRPKDKHRGNVHNRLWNHG